jgi:IclR family pca regulon transcriptional regulator
MGKDAGIKESSRDFVAGLMKGLSVIECFDDEHERLTSAEVAAMTGLTRAAARRCLLTLHQLGYASYDGKQFTLAPRVLRLGYAYLLSTPLAQLVQPFVEQLNERVQECCSVTILDGHEIVYIARSLTKRVNATGPCIGSRLPAYCTAMGRVLLAALEPDEARRRLEMTERRRVTPYTCTNVDDLANMISEIRTVGYCINNQERMIGLVAISVPIMDAGGNTVAAINVATSATRVPAHALSAQFLPHLREIQKNLRPLVRA